MGKDGVKLRSHFNYPFLRLNPPCLLLLQLKRIGDAILTAPALGALRQALPEAELTLVLSGAAASLGPALGMVDTRLNYRSGSLNPGIWRRVAQGKWDAALDFTGSDRSSFMVRLSRARDRVGYEKDAKNRLRRAFVREFCLASVRDLHTVDFHHALVGFYLEKLGIPAPIVPDFGHLQLPPGVQLPELPTRFFVVHPGTARPEKLWPVAYWAEVAAAAEARLGCPLVLTGSQDAAEAAHLADLQSHLGGVNCVNLVGKLSLLELAAVLSRAEVVLGVDSAAMHLAATFQRPQVALFGPTNPFHWRPRHPAARVLLAGCPENDSLQQFTPRMPQRPMSQLLPERVIRSLDSLLLPRA